MRKSSNRPTKRKTSASTTAAKREVFSLVDIQPKTESQRRMMDGYMDGQNIVAYGSAGSGKTFIACYLALKDLYDKEKNKIIIVRSAVPTRNQGFLPGSLDEKSAVYQTPYVSIVNELCQNGAAWEIFTKKDTIQFMTTGYVRGITFDDAVIIVDEFQNMTQHEIYSLLTRMGENTQVILCGDTKQSDLDKKKEESCFGWVTKVVDRMPEWFDPIKFTPDDIVRSEFVKKLIMVTEDL